MMQASKLRSSSPFQFTSGHLFYFLWLCATATALLGWLGIPVACFILLIWVQILAGARREAGATSGKGEFVSTVAVDVASPSTSQPIARSYGTRYGVTKIETLVVLLIATLLIGLFVPAVSEYDPMRQAETSMKMVAKAVAAYEQQHGRLPSFTVTDELGQPQHSWRALILPYLREDKLSAAYRWDQAWNSPANVELMQYRPWHYRTYYPDHEEQRELSSLQLLLDAEQNWFVIEHEQASRPWLEPTEDISWMELEELPSDDHGFWRHGFFSSSYRGRLVVSNQQTIQIHPRSDSSSPALLPLGQRVALCARTRAATVELGEPYRQIHWGNVLRLAMFLVAVLYPLRWLSAIRDDAAPPG
ncbi:MAG: DUF1559 domain-containing protein [Pirellulaceae bacterium]